MIPRWVQDWLVLAKWVRKGKQPLFLLVASPSVRSLTARPPPAVSLDAARHGTSPGLGRPRDRPGRSGTRVSGSEQALFSRSRSRAAQLSSDRAERRA